MSSRAKSFLPAAQMDMPHRALFALRWARASMRWSQHWPLQSIMERIFSKADAIDLPDYKMIRSEIAVQAANG